MVRTRTRSKYATILLWVTVWIVWCAAAGALTRVAFNAATGAQGALWSGAAMGVHLGAMTGLLLWADRRGWISLSLRRRSLAKKKAALRRKWRDTEEEVERLRSSKNER